MAKAATSLSVSDDLILNKIYLIRGQKIMLDEDLADLYQVPTKRLNEQVKRNVSRFPADFMFQLTEKEFTDLRSHFATAKSSKRRALPYAFTEHGVLMLSSVLNSPQAIQVNIQIMRIYSKMREMLITNQEILLKLERLERKVEDHDQNIQLIFKYLKQLLTPPTQNRPRIGFRRPDEKDEPTSNSAQT